MINAYINTDIANKTNKTDTDLAILAQRDLLNLKMNPAAEKPSGNMLEKLMNNPALINILLTIAEMF